MSTFYNKNLYKIPPFPGIYVFTDQGRFGVSPGTERLDLGETLFPCRRRTTPDRESRDSRDL